MPDIDEAELDLKRKFAAELLANPTQAWLIATRLVPDDVARRCLVLSWIKDPVVLQIQRELRSRSEQAPLPTKYDVARRVYALLVDEKLSVREEAQVRRLYSELMGFIEKPSGKKKGWNTDSGFPDSGVLVIREPAPEPKEQGC